MNTYVDNDVPTFIQSYVCVCVNTYIEDDFPTTKHTSTPACQSGNDSNE